MTGQERIRPGRITDAQVQAYHDAWHRTPPGAPGDRTRAGLAAAYVQREREIREDRAASGQVMDREARIRERARDLLDEIAETDPASVPEVADEIARYVLELEDSGVARDLLPGVLARLNGAYMGRTRVARPGNLHLDPDRIKQVTGETEIKARRISPEEWAIRNDEQGVSGYEL